MVDDNTEWTVHGSQRAYTSEWVNVDIEDVHVPDGTRLKHHVIRFPRTSVGAVVIEDRQILLLWRHRFITRRWGWEIPAGWCDDGEDPVDAAGREVEEETGYHASTIRPLMTYFPMSGIATQHYRLFLATDVERSREPDSAETARTAWFDLAEIPALLLDGLVPDGPSVTALGFYLATAGR